MGSRFRATSKGTSPDTDLVLLGILTLTARFHGDLVKYAAHAANLQPGNNKSRPNKSDSSAASEYYAESLRKALGPLGMSMSTASVERVQAFLMLGLYEWSQTRPKTGGLSAWMYVGVAIRMAQALGLGFGDKPEKSRHARQRSGQGSASTTSTMPNPDLMIEKEIKRRTMFSCLILDRLLACGKERVCTIDVYELQIQLPCSDMAFDLGKDIRTGFLKEPAHEQRHRDVNEDSILSRFIKLVDLWGQITKYSFAGGRHIEDYPPWDERTRFHQLREKLDNFYSDLPLTFTLSESNYYKHENYCASSVYVSLHMLGSICSVMLHREYIPYLPIRCKEGPKGPLDGPIFPPNEYETPPGFWADSAEQVFKAARNIVDLIETCRDKLPKSALVVFAVWMAAFVGQYAGHFPLMDTKKHMLGDNDEMVGAEITYQTLVQISAWLKLAAMYVDTFKKVDAYFTSVRQKFQRWNKSPAGQVDDEMVIKGGGLEEWRIHNPSIVNNGLIMAEDERHAIYEASDRSRATTVDSIVPDSHIAAASAVGVDRVKTPRSAPSFKPINSANMAPPQPESPAAPSPRLDGLPGPGNPTAPPSPWNRYPVPGSSQAPPPVHTQPSPSQPYTPLPQSNTVSPWDEAGFMDHLHQAESMRMAEALGSADLQGFSYGDVVPESNMFYPGGQSAQMLPFGSYDPGSVW